MVNKIQSTAHINLALLITLEEVTKYGSDITRKRKSFLWQFVWQLSREENKTRVKTLFLLVTFFRGDNVSLLQVQCFFYFRMPLSPRMHQWSRIQRFPETILFSSKAPAGMSILSPWLAMMITVPCGRTPFVWKLLAEHCSTTCLEGWLQFVFSYLAKTFEDNHSFL